jgi:hypothetical protein
VGADSFTYSVTDSKGASATATVTITVSQANRAPVANNDAFTLPQDAPATAFDVLANDSDPDGDALTITTVSTPAHGTASIAGNKVSYKPVTGYSGTDSLTYTISDGKGGTATATVTFTITAANRAPVANGDSATVAQDAPATLIDVLANDSDPDGDALTLTSVTAPAHGTATISGNKVSYKPSAGYSGPDSLSYTISDGKGGTATAVVSITVTPAAPANRAPVANGDSATVAQDAPATLIDVLANDSDPDGDTLTITSVTAPAHGTASVSGNKVSYKPSAGYSGPDSLSYTISDGKGGTASAVVAITVTPVNHVPVANADSFSLPQNSGATLFDVLANDSDPDGDSLTIVSTSTPLHGTASISGGKVSYKPATDYSGPDSFSYTVSDGKGGTATALVSITVTPVVKNLAPTANDDFVFIYFNTAANVNVLANDTDPEGDTLTVTSFSQPTHGTVTRGSGQILVYTPNNNFVGIDSFSYTISDGHGNTASANVRVYVDP